MAPSENEYQEYFLGVKAAGAWGWQPHYLHEPNVMKSGSLSLLEPSGPNRACYGTALCLRLCNYFGMFYNNFYYDSWVPTPPYV